MSTTMTVKGQVTIPKNIRDHLQLSPGDRVDCGFAEDGTVRLTPVRKPVVRAGRSKFSALVGSRRKGARTAELMNLLRGYGDDTGDPGFR